MPSSVLSVYLIKLSLKHKAAILWNELPWSVQEIISLSVFKHAIKN